MAEIIGAVIYILLIILVAGVPFIGVVSFFVLMFADSEYIKERQRIKLLKEINKIVSLLPEDERSQKFDELTKKLFEKD